MSSRGVTITLSVLVLVFVGMLFSPPAYADSQARIVRLSYTEGTVQIDRATGAGFEKAIMNMPIVQGVRLWTRAGSYAEVEFEEGSTLRLAPDTMVYFRELGLRDGGTRFTMVDVDDGTAYFNFKHKGNEEFRVGFARQEIALTHLVHFRLDVGKQQPQLVVFKGEVDLAGPAQAVKVKKDETLTLDLNDPGRYDLAKGIQTFRDDDWDSERNDYHNRYASNSYTNSPYYYGRSDLNYYGGWNYFSGYGYLWRPYDVGYGWDPFYSGAWSWYPGWGWTWVSTYPWGWTPYRYGSWLFVSNYGWCWRPGGWNTWTRVPPVYNPPPAYRAPQPPATAFVGGGTGGGTPTVIVGGSGDSTMPRGRGRWTDDRDFPRARRVPRGEASVPAAPTGSVTSTGQTTTAAPAPASSLATSDSSGSAARRVPNGARDLPMRGRERFADRNAPARMRPEARPAPSSPPLSRPSELRMTAPPPSAPPRMSAPQSAPAHNAPAAQRGPSRQ